jgi:hypothetical protein
MTIEEAIRELHNIADYDIDSQRGKDKYDALDMAINALELADMLTGRPCGVCKHHEHGLCSSWNCPFEGTEKNA